MVEADPQAAVRAFGAAMKDVEIQKRERTRQTRRGPGNVAAPDPVPSLPEFIGVILAPAQSV